MKISETSRLNQKQTYYSPLKWYSCLIGADKFQWIFNWGLFLHYWFKLSRLAVATGMSHSLFQKQRTVDGVGDWFFPPLFEILLLLSFSQPRNPILICNFILIICFIFFFGTIEEIYQVETYLTRSRKRSVGHWHKHSWVFFLLMLLMTPC